MLNKPVVSIIIPTFNREKQLARCINSLFKQTEKKWEAIVVDNSKNQQTKSFIDGIADSRVRYVKVDNKGVIALSRNVGAAKAKADYLAFLDDDDWWTPNKLKYSLARLAQGNDIVYHDMYFRSVRKINWPLIFKSRDLDSKNPYKDLLLHGNGLITSSVVLKKELFILVGGMSETADLIAAEDYDCWLNLAKLDFKFSRIAKPLGFYWKGLNTSSVQRMPKILHKIRQLHGYKNESKSFYLYSLGRAYFLLHKYKVATKCFKHLFRLERRRAIILSKAFWMQSYICIWNFFYG